MCKCANVQNRFSIEWGWDGVDGEGIRRVHFYEGIYLLI